MHLKRGNYHFHGVNHNRINLRNVCLTRQTLHHTIFFTSDEISSKNRSRPYISSFTGNSEYVLKNRTKLYYFLVIKWWFDLILYVGFCIYKGCLWCRTICERVTHIARELDPLQSKSWTWRDSPILDRSLLQSMVRICYSSRKESLSKYKSLIFPM